MVTPLAMARLTATIANGGRVLQPFLVEEVRRGDRVLERGTGRDLGQAVSEATASQVAGMMREAVEEGTARRMALRGVSVAAKTGTGEKDHTDPDVWMVAFAPVENPEVVVVVAVEEGYSGGETAGPIAKKVLRALLDQ
jgi:peptidoglycan glycosyltransferase